MSKTISSKLKNSRNRLLSISLVFVAILLISSPFIPIFTHMASAENVWTVTFETGTGTNEPNRVYSVPDGELLKDIYNVDLSAPVAKPGSLFIGWTPVINENEEVKSDLTYTAQWITDFSTPSPTLNHQWSIVLNNRAYIPWTVPAGALSLEFNDVSNSGQTYLDYAYMVIDDSGSASIYFLCLTRHGGSSDYVNYFGIPATAVASTTYSGLKFSVWKLDLPEYVVRTIMSGGVLSGSFNCIVGSGGNSINGVTLTFTNVRVVAEHYIYVNDPYDSLDAVLYRITPVVGIIGQYVTANPLHIIGHTYDDVTSSASKSGIIPSTGSLTLKLYYQKNSAYLWNISSILEGVEEIHTVYNGQIQKLSDFIDPNLLVDGKLFTIIWPPSDPADPAAKYILEGGVYMEDPAGVDVGIYTQNLAVTPDYKIYYHGNYISENATLVKLDDGLEYEDITYAMGLPLPVPVSLIIDPAPLTVMTASASKEYDGTELTKIDDAPIIEGLVDGIIIPYVFTATSHNPNEYTGFLVNGETVGFIFTGTQIYSGTSYNTYEIVWADSDDPDNSFTANKRNYAINSETLGILEVYTTVTYYENFPNTVADFNGTAPVDNNHYCANDTVTVLDKADLSVYGYSFIGWNTELNGTGTPYDSGDSFYMPDENVALYAQWMAKSDIVVTFDANAPVGATVVSGPTPLSKLVEFASAYGALAVVDVYGYEFDGWYTTAAGSGGVEVTSTTVVSNAVDHTLYARWTAVNYTVSVVDSFAVVSGAGVYHLGDVVTINAGLRAGYTFAGWLVSSGGVTLVSPLSASTSFVMPANNVVVTAQWNYDVEFTVIYRGNYHTRGVVPTDYNWYGYGDRVTVLDYGDLARTGYSFLGWSTNSTASVAEFKAGSIFTIYGDVELFAVWSPDEYTVTYEPGDHGTFTAQVTDGLHYDDVTPDAPVVTGETGWNFTAWSPIPSATVTDNATYVAQWVQVSSPSPSPSPSPSRSVSVTPSPSRSVSVTPTASPSVSASLTPPPTGDPHRDIPDIPPVEDVFRWAVVNLILSIVGVVLVAVVFVRAMLLKKKDDREEGKQKNTNTKTVGGAGYGGKNGKGSVSDEKYTQRRHLWLITALILAVAGLVVFLLTEDMSLPMGWVDKWTIANTIILIAEIIAIIFVFKTVKQTKTINTTSTDKNTP